MTDTELQAALLADGWQVMAHHGPGPRWGAIGGHEVAGLVCALRDGGYEVRGCTSCAEIRVRVNHADSVRAAWAEIEVALVTCAVGGWG